MLVEVNKENKWKGKYLDSLGLDNLRAKKVPYNRNNSSNSKKKYRVSKIIDLWKPKRRLPKQNNRKKQ
jgi:hypothetical protein